MFIYNKLWVHTQVRNYLNSTLWAEITYNVHVLRSNKVLSKYCNRPNILEINLNERMDYGKRRIYTGWSVTDLMRFFVFLSVQWFYIDVMELQHIKWLKLMWSMNNGNVLILTLIWIKMKADTKHVLCHEVTESAKKISFCQRTLNIQNRGQKAAELFDT